MILSFKNKFIVVQGGTQGFGLYLVKKLLELEAKVIFTGLEKEVGEKIINQVNNKNLFFFHLNLAIKSEIDSFFSYVSKLTDKIDGYFHYAGVTDLSPLDSCSEETYDYIMNINTKSVFFSLQNLLPFMKKFGGSIVIVNSTHAKRGQIDRAAYAMSKSSLITISSHIALHYGKFKIRSNNITMGWTLTENEIELRKKLGQSVKDINNIVKRNIPLGRLIKYDDLIGGALYLLSDQSSMVSGTNLYINGAESI
jgi:NAD(P)-dependent dehydrogenase (short-subunit alcohol dehydrogenase family)